MLDSKTIRRIRTQRLFGRWSIFLLAPLFVAAIKLAGYRVQNLCETRRRIREILRSHPGPWIICANHLTLIDSAILTHAMAPVWVYMADYGRLPWNLPERRNFHRNRFLKVFCYLAKCIPVTRRGERETIRVALAKCIYVLKSKDSLLVFPEGGRSRTGLVDKENYAYGVGRLLARVPDCRVMCVYLRGEGQTGYSNFPRRGERFVMDIRELNPRTVTGQTGLRAQKDYAKQIIDTLGRMETAYFAGRRERHRRFGNGLCQGQA
jgi:1-acyl-sn-glycerol-3-phosphate acyltransferase